MNRINFNRLLPLLIPGLVLLFQEIYFFSPKLIYLAAALIFLAEFFVAWQFSRASKIDQRWWNYLILPATASLAILSYSVFLSSRGAIQALFIFNAVFLYLYLRHVYYYLLNPSAYEVFSIENISSYINWLAFFLVAATIYGLESFLNLPISWLVLFMLSITVLLVYQIIWANKIESRVALLYILNSSLILTELFWSISFLPFNYNISGLILGICYYVIIGLVKNHLLLKLDAAKIRVYLILGAVSLSLVLLTVSWI